MSNTDRTKNLGVNSDAEYRRPDQNKKIIKVHVV
jgi:hypothetical protein